jgi:hypothetical protein
MKEGDREALREMWANAPRSLLMVGGMLCWFAFFQWIMGNPNAARVAAVGVSMLAVGIFWYRYRRSRSSNLDTP